MVGHASRHPTNVRRESHHNGLKVSQSIQTHGCLPGYYICIQNINLYNNRLLIKIIVVSAGGQRIDAGEAGVILSEFG